MNIDEANRVILSSFQTQWALRGYLAMEEQ